MKTKKNVVSVNRQLSFKGVGISIITKNSNDTVIGNVNLEMICSESLNTGMQISL